MAALGRTATLSGFVGYADGQYDRVRFDLNGDGTTVGDRDLDLPRLARLTWGVQATYTRPVGRSGHVAVRVAMTHRDGSALTDDNTGSLNSGDLLEASLRFSPNAAVEFTLYGRNLLDDSIRTSDVDLTGLVNSTFAPLREGRVLGLEVRGFL